MLFQLASFSCGLEKYSDLAAEIFSHGGAEPRRIIYFKVAGLCSPFSLSVPWSLRVIKLLRQQNHSPARAFCASGAVEWL
jgi:hypothetical protein